jgi:addiction module HigA family antidote
MPMKNPPHPGEIIRDLYLAPLGLTVTAAAAGLSVTRKTLSLLVNGHAPISPEMALRLAQGLGRSPESWLQLQLQYDLAQTRRRLPDLAVRTLVPQTPDEPAPTS